VYARSISVSGVVARQNMIYLMGRKRWELFAQFVGKLPIKTLKWYGHSLLQSNMSCMFLLSCLITCVMYVSSKIDFSILVLTTAGQVSPFNVKCMN
jgi:hypothetical protein